jgi:hypothetical protein
MTISSSVIPSSIITHFDNGVFRRKSPPQAAHDFEGSLEALHEIDAF